MPLCGKEKNIPYRDAHGRLGSALHKLMHLLVLSSLHWIQGCLLLLLACEVGTECFCFCLQVLRGDWELNLSNNGEIQYQGMCFCCYDLALPGILDSSCIGRWILLDKLQIKAILSGPMIHRINPDHANGSHELIMVVFGSIPIILW